MSLHATSFFVLTHHRISNLSFSAADQRSNFSVAYSLLTVHPCETQARKQKSNFHKSCFHVRICCYFDSHAKGGGCSYQWLLQRTSVAAVHQMQPCKHHKQVVTFHGDKTYPPSSAFKLHQSIKAVIMVAIKYAVFIPWQLYEEHHHQWLRLSRLYLEMIKIWQHYLRWYSIVHLFQIVYGRQCCTVGRSVSLENSNLENHASKGQFDRIARATVAKVASEVL